jgi:hypothetical protein
MRKCSRAWIEKFMIVNPIDLPLELVQVVIRKSG